MSTTVAAIDCGTNTIRLLIATQSATGALTEMTREQRFVGLGQGVDATGNFSDEALQRTLAACEEYATIIEQFPVDKARFVATSATRDAANREVLLTGVAQRLGITPEVISGDEEASLSFRGVLSGLVAARNPILVIDSGGGSTEFIRGLTDGTIIEKTSLDIGSRRIKERYLNSDPPTDPQIYAARKAIRALLAATNIDWEEVRTAVAVAGTATTMSALIQRLPTYQRHLVHLSRLHREDIADLTEHLLTSTVAEIAALGSVLPERAPVLASGALLLNEIAQRIGPATTIISEADILDGIALGLLPA
ncbi:MAG: Ppx/GppA family phosphatase [Propionibacteriaceae bacterium]|jgi:exopolyphosphatase/guanosine-5'-triphosphate,3'-diphosphate pyrophosphatase|nr:Ppx/GppA family phosphatase [Propionibacteriaceae bacterium]